MTKKDQFTSTYIKKYIDNLRKLKISKNDYDNYKSFDKEINHPVLPFKYGYQTAYSKTYLSRLNNQNIFELDIEHLSDKIKDDYNNYLTVRNNNIKNNKNIFLTLGKKSSNFNKCKSQEDLKEENFILNKIFPDKKELNKYSNLPFFYLTKKQIDLSENETINERLLKEDFIYRISHGDRFLTNNINNNFNKNKSVKKGLTLNYIGNKNKLSVPDIKLELNINKLKNKSEKISTKKKYFLILQKQLNDLKNGKIFKKLEEDIINFKEENIENELPKKIYEIKENKEIKKEKDFNKTYLIGKKKTIKKVKSYIEKSNNEHFKELFDNNNKKNLMKKPLKYPINFYSNKQLEIKKKRYEKTHKNGWKEFKRKINIRNLEYITNKNLKNPIILCVLEPNRNLQKKIITNKMAYLRECRIRDKIISNKLKYDFNKDDLKRILNGQKPWKGLGSNNSNNNDIKNEKK